MKPRNLLCPKCLNSELERVQEHGPDGVLGLYLKCPVCRRLYDVDLKEVLFPDSKGQQK